MPVYYSHNKKDKIFEKIITFINRQKIKSVLDVGCSDGYFINLIKKRCPSVKKIIGVEPDAALADNHPSIVHGTINKLPFKKGVFELVIAKDVIEHVHDNIGAFKECLRVSKRYVFLSAPAPFNVNAWADYQHVRPYTQETFMHLAYDFDLDLVVVGAIRRMLPFRLIALLWMQPIDEVAVYACFSKRKTS